MGYGEPDTEQPRLVVFKDGKHWQYEGALDGEDIFKYMECVTLPFLPVADVARMYCGAQLVYKDILRKILPGKLRRYLFKWFAFPIAMMSPLFLCLCCFCCCRGGSREADSEKTSNGESKKSVTSKKSETSKKED